MDELLRQWGRNVEAGRLALGLTQADLGRACDVGQSTVARWEAGKMAPRDNHKLRIATALHQDVRQLFPLVRVVA